MMPEPKFVETHKGKWDIIKIRGRYPERGWRIISEHLKKADWYPVMELEEDLKDLGIRYINLDRNYLQRFERYGILECKERRKEYRFQRPEYISAIFFSFRNEIEKDPDNLLKTKLYKTEIKPLLLDYFNHALKSEKLPSIQNEKEGVSFWLGHSLSALELVLKPESWHPIYDASLKAYYSTKMMDEKVFFDIHIAPLLNMIKISFPKIDVNNAIKAKLGATPEQILSQIYEKIGVDFSWDRYMGHLAKRDLENGLVSDPKEVRNELSRRKNEREEVLQKISEFREKVEEVRSMPDNMRAMKEIERLLDEFKHEFL